MLSVASKPNSNKKQYGLIRLPVDRKQAAQDRVLVKPDENDECVVEYDSDDDEHGGNKNAKFDTTSVTL